MDVIQNLGFYNAQTRWNQLWGLHRAAHYLLFRWQKKGLSLPTGYDWPTLRENPVRI